MNADAALKRGWLDELADVLGDRLSTAGALLAQHGQDESYHEGQPPEAVAFPESTEEVARLVAICARHGKPVIPFGVGTSLEGHVAALSGGVCLDLSRMNDVLEVNAEDMDCAVQAGVTRKQLNEYLRDTGLFFPIDPGADATLGGMAATGASGTNAVRYGTMRENVIGLTVVLADGSVVHTGGRARKSSAGYDLTRLMIGSEGTLGVITEVRLRLAGQPEAISSAVCAFPTLEGAVETAQLVIQSGIPVARMELLDEVQMDACNRYSGLDYPVQPTIFFEFHGSDAGVAEQAERTGELAQAAGGTDFAWATRPEERSQLWAARHAAFYAALALRPGGKGWPTDVAVPISRLADCIIETKRDIAQSGLIAPLVGHVGDGNFHLVLVIDPDDAEEMTRAQALNDRLVARALKMAGTCTGEHGIGYGKMHLLEQEHPDLLPAMAAIKRALDPANILNPGKIVKLDG
ncbi:FAD-binding oxidoreductase [Rhodovibrio sodomensis]|uniref:D-lactate dehydrogenase (cytochrome) n=1 Tax=Rhodovibrio sodomensis TaxID=1088 RepID=A0ABS1DIP3_9PROT|nr:FAD-linked oxidase C-terminal domain-containing protein [Rhodovibrio sodomensis]MBK1670344.1 FAD-binding oxidoreductase [Rhodovibrio sodomensis]